MIGMLVVLQIQKICLVARAFNQPLNGWDVSSGEKFTNMFTGTYVFNQPLNDWDVSSGEKFKICLMVQKNLIKD